LGENLRERDNLEHLGIDGRIILKHLQEMHRRVWTELIWIRAGICVWGVVNALMILQVQNNVGNFMTS
jgi:hypothetical protein